MSSENDRPELIVERLSVPSLILRILPTARREKIVVLRVVDSGAMAWIAVRLFGKLFGWKVSKAKFELVDIKDEGQLLVRLRIAWKDVAEICRWLTAEGRFPEAAGTTGEFPRLNRYLTKQLALMPLISKEPLTRGLYLVQVARWFQKQSGNKEAPILFLNRRFGFDAVVRYGENNRVRVRNLLGHVTFRFFRDGLRRCYQHWRRFLWHVQHLSFPKKQARSGFKPKMAVDYYGQFNLNEPERYSDYFCYQVSGLKGEDLIGLYQSPTDPVDRKKWEQHREHGIDLAVLDPRATRIAVCPPEKSPASFSFPSVPIFDVKGSRFDRRCLRKEALGYWNLKNYWRDLFSRKGIRIYLSWYKYNGFHCAIADALNELNGVTAMYQRALDVTGYAETATDVDLSFGYSSMMGDLEKNIGSVIPYYVVTGYLGDHRFPLLKKHASQVRETILKNGASWVVSFTDESTAADGRWHTGHAHMREDYRFLLEKCLREPWLGLILKPKIPATLKERLGPVAALLEAALKTGRCYLYEGGPITGSFPPAIAALSADLAIHEHLSSPTAAFEAALAGTPTLLLDREGWSVSPLYELGEGQTVFRDWESLWSAVLEKRSAKNNSPIGDWSPLLDRLDPFRDGGAATRMGNFLKSVLEDLKKGAPKQDALENAACLYRKKWGEDKIIHVG